MISDVPFVGLADLVRPLRPLVRKVPAGMPAREAASLLATAHYGGAWALDPEGAGLALINVAMLALRSGGNPPLYRMRPSATRVVNETDLHSIPDDPPPLLRAAGIVEAHRPETGDRLWGDYVGLGWYLFDGAEASEPWIGPPRVYLVGLTYPDGIAVAKWSPAWTGADLNEQMPAPDFGSDLINAINVWEHHRFAIDAARYLIVLGLLELVQDGPLRFEIDPRTGERAVRPKDLGAKSFRGPTLPRPEPMTAIDPEARVLADTIVRGHLQRYRVGEGRKKVEWRYVDDYNGKRWFAPRYTVERDFAHAGLANENLIFRGRK